MLELAHYKQGEEAIQCIHDVSRVWSFVWLHVAMER